MAKCQNVFRRARSIDHLCSKWRIETSLGCDEDKTARSCAALTLLHEESGVVGCWFHQVLVIPRSGAPRRPRPTSYEDCEYLIRRTPTHLRPPDESARRSVID